MEVPINRYKNIRKSPPPVKRVGATVYLGRIGRGHKTMPPLLDCSGCSDKQLLMKERL